MYKTLVVLSLAAVAIAVPWDDDSYKGDGGYYPQPYGYNYAHGFNRLREGHVNYVNGLRQLYVNKQAKGVGAGTGTAKYYGAPGTPVGVLGHYDYGYAPYGYNYGYKQRAVYPVYKKDNMKDYPVKDSNPIWGISD